MSPLIIGLIIIIVLMALIFSGLWIGFALWIVAFGAIFLLTDLNAGFTLVRVAWGSNDNFLITMIPLFIFMGELLLAGKASERLYDGLTPWVERVPGGLIHSNIIACTVFAALTGSSAVVTATVGEIAVPALASRGYNDKLSIGSLAGAGTLGLLIPPSLVMIIYGFLVNQSIGQLFMAGLFPGLIASVLFMTYITITSVLHRSRQYVRGEYTWKDRFAGLGKIFPIVVIIAAILGLIYAGWATCVESATVGVILVVILCAITRTLNMKAMRHAISKTIRLSGMLLLVLTGAMLLSAAFSYLGISRALATLVTSLPASPYMILIFICLLYLGMGCLFDGISMMVMTLPIIYPSIIALGFDPIWFGVILVIMIEIAQITPPIGMNLFILQGISGLPFGLIVRGAVPFFFLLLVAALIVVLFPQLALWLPSTMVAGP